MRQLLIALLALLVVADVQAGPPRRRARAAWAWAGEAARPVEVVQPVAAASSTTAGSDDALDEVNAYRAKRGLPPFQRDPLLTQAALACAKQRAARGIHGHLPESDFSYLPAGGNATAAGCGALEDSWGWGTCCMDENYAYAGAAWVRGSDGRRYMHLFVR